MRTKAIKFKNADDFELSARLELPIGEKPRRFAIFAHCFTCGKNAKAATNISRELTQNGFGVLRFDFTGLGQSEGEFEDTGFTTNVEDIISAAKFLEEFYFSPTLLVGHSLGGTAVIHASAKVESVKAICTIGAPAEASHVLHVIGHSREEIEKNGKASVSIADRPFMIGQKFLSDLEKHSSESVLNKLRKAILIMHSPQDSVVEIENAAALFKAAHHPKSFISLDGANHLLTKQEDAEYASSVLGAWVKRYIPEVEEPFTTENHTAVQLGSDGFTTEIIAGEHRFLADEPKSVGGNNLGPSPYQLLNAALGACTAMTIKMYADRKKWDLTKVTVHLDHSSEYAKDSSNPEAKKSRIDTFNRYLEVEGDLDDEKRARLLEIANKCPVHRTLTESDVKVETRYLE
ncbi:OsmC family protein [Cryomorpha ignava]|uniref:OsmC family protein n=1 Tax=Cryomorpha ignava TaxID=101383 RepID=A0A7K3WT97_9FLAO|nr:bifunctional alpha/beta hydrolase/OsmC family protein [Cryomorpha ignava]NEN24768.1 OsmC family protein [Cryomorpha ignava]